MNTLKKNSTKLYIEKSLYALGTLNNIKIFNCFDRDLVELAAARVLEIDDLMSAFKPNSDISKLNQNAGKGFVEIHPDTFKLLKRSIEFSELSFGAFDITISPLVKLWGIGKKENYIPLEYEISEIKTLIDYTKLELNDKDISASLKYNGQAIDLGGIAKGFAAEEIKKLFIENNVNSALINLGGNIITIGTHPNGEPWKIGLQNPLKPTGQYLGILSATDKTIVTSGSNEKFFIKDNIRYHHILDPKTGKPAQSALLSITAICDSSTDADALTTSIFVLGPERGMELANKLKAEIIFVTENLEVIASNSLRDNLKPLNLKEMRGTL